MYYSFGKENLWKRDEKSRREPSQRHCLSLLNSYFISMIANSDWRSHLNWKSGVILRNFILFIVSTVEFQFFLHLGNFNPIICVLSLTQVFLRGRKTTTVSYLCDGKSLIHWCVIFSILQHFPLHLFSALFQLPYAGLRQLYTYRYIFKGNFSQTFQILQEENQWLK